MAKASFKITASSMSMEISVEMDGTGKEIASVLQDVREMVMHAPRIDPLSVPEKKEARSDSAAARLSRR